MSITDEWIRKMWCIYVYNGTQPEKEGNNAICSNMDGPRYKSEKDKHHIMSLMCRI